MRGIHFVQITVPDLDAGIVWYRDVLGLTLVSTDSYPVAAELADPAIRLLLHRAERSTTIDYPHQAQTLVAWHVESLRFEMARLSAAGVTFLHDEAQTWPDGLYIGFRDPFGNVHELVELNGINS